MASDLVTLAWNNAGQPAPTTAATQTGECARCGAATDLVRVTQAVSKKFTSYGSWLNPRSRAGLCPACVWIYRTPELRSENHRLTPTTLTAPSKEDVHRELSAGVLACDVALVVPIRPGRNTCLSGRSSVKSPPITVNCHGLTLTLPGCELRPR